MTAEFVGFLGEQLAGTEAIRSSGAARFVMQKFYLMLQRVLKTNISGA